MSSESKPLPSAYLPVFSVKLHCPPLDEIAEVLSKNLTSGFKEVSVEVCECPDLQEAPFHLASEGLSGKPRLIDIGGPPYLIPTVNKKKVYTFDKLNHLCGGVEPAFFIGAGAGPFPYAKTNCEMIANLKIVGEHNYNKTRIVKMVDVEKGQFRVETLPGVENRFSLLGNFLLSEGKTGQVLKIHCKKRTGDDNIITAIRKALFERYESMPVGLGGVLLLNSGKVKQHIMPDFSDKPLNSEEDLNKWLFFCEMNAPLVAVGTLISADLGLDLRLQHFHSFNLLGEGGHYHYDTTPDTVEYTAYLTTAEYIYRVDKPEVSYEFGKD